MHSSHHITLPSDLPLNPAITDDLCEDLISKLQGRNPILLVTHINEKHLFTRANRVRTNYLFLGLATCQ